MKTHTPNLAALEGCTVPTVTCRVLFVRVILAQEQRRVVHCNLTEHPTAHWAAHQVVEALPGDEAPRDLLRDRIDSVACRQRIKPRGIQAVWTAAAADPASRPRAGDRDV